MPEGDTVYRSARALEKVLAGEVLTRTDFRVPAFATVDLTGERVDSIASVGKHLLHRVGGFTVHTHLGMDGTWHIYRPGAPWKRPAWQARVVLATEDCVTVGFLLATIEVVPRDREVDIVGHLGPDLLGEKWDPEEALRRLSANPDRPVGLALLDQTVMAGLGNVYRNELCFLRGVLPTRPVSEVADLEGFVSLAQRVISVNKDRVERSTTGDLRAGRMLWVSQREKKACLRCGTPIRKGTLGDTSLTGRHTFYCPRCQT